MQNIVDYANEHQNAHLTILSISEAGVGVLTDMQKKLQFASDELQRMEDESGIPLDEEQAAKVDTYFRLTRRIKASRLLARHMRNRFCLFTSV